METGVQISSFKPILLTEAQVQTALDRIKAMGCDTVQLQWIDRSVPIGAIAAALETAGLRSVSVQDFYEVIRQDPEYYIGLNRATGGEWMCVSRIPDRLKTPAGLDEYVAELREFQEKLDHYGQKLCFHPVSGDFTPIGGMDPVEYLLEAMPELAVCADLYHLNKCRDMAAWLRRYAGRVCMVHFKEGKKMPDGTEALVPAGQGDMDWTGVVEACLETGVSYAFVEQERWQGDPFDRIAEALTWLRGKTDPHHKT